jgi:hypothetical protein
MILKGLNALQGKNDVLIQNEPNAAQLEARDGPPTANQQ